MEATSDLKKIDEALDTSVRLSKSGFDTIIVKIKNMMSKVVAPSDQISVLKALKIELMLRLASIDSLL